MKALTIFSFLLAGWSLSAQELRIQKDYSESFSSDAIHLVEIENKYGDIIVNAWEKDSIKVEVTLEAFGKNQELVNKEIQKVDINIRQIGSMVSGITVFRQTKTRGFLGDLLSEIEDASKSLVGNSKLSIDYEVFLPENLELSITNKYGDVFIGKSTSDARVNIAHGDLRADQLTGTVYLAHSFGKHTINDLGEASLSLKGVTSDISNASVLTFESSSSQIFIGRVNELRLDNRNDKILVDEAETVSGKGSFADLTVKKLSKNARLDFSYGEIYLDQILRNFGAIRINGKSTDINLIINQGSYLSTYLEGDQSQMILPNSMLTMSNTPVENTNRVALSGMVGATQVEVSELNVIADMGSLIVSIEETDMFTNKD
jgi:hypothetical protein